MKKMTASILLITAMCMALTACETAAKPEASDTTADPKSAASSDTSEISAPAATSPASTEAVTSELSADAGSSVDTSELFTARDYEIGCSDDCTTVMLSDGGCTVNGKGAETFGSTVTITAAGTYKLTGALSNGQIIVDADDAKVQIVLDGASVTCTGSAALYVRSADKVFVTTAAGGGTLTSTGEFSQSDDSKVDGAVFAKSDVTFNGAGTLTISSDTGHGIVCKDDLKITSGTYDITAAKKGIDCNESVRIADGSITINSGTDGIHAENSGDASKAFVYVGGGRLTITAGSDAIDASGEVVADSGTFVLTSGGGDANASPHRNNDFGMRWDRDNAQSDGTSETSCKGLKADAAITINGGTFTINSADDSVHTSGVFAMTNGELTVASGDDGIHSDTSVEISGGTVSIAESYEGIEGEIIEIRGGNISVKASDDGMNAAGGETTGGGMFESDPNALLHISGGRIVVNADGDGLDSNGTLLVSGGETYVSGPTNAGNGALDTGTSATITGGVVIAAGSTGMAVNFGQESTQCSMLCTFDSTVNGGTELTLTDSSGNILASFTPEKSYQCAVISTPDIKVGETYTVTAGSSKQTVEMTSTIYGAGGGFGGFGGGGRGGFGGRGGRPDENGEMPEMPDRDRFRSRGEDFESGDSVPTLNHLSSRA